MLFRTPPLDSPDVSEQENPSPIEPDGNNTNFMHNGENNSPGRSTCRGGEEDSNPGQFPDDDHGIQDPENNDSICYDSKPPVMFNPDLSWTFYMKSSGRAETMDLTPNEELDKRTIASKLSSLRSMLVTEINTRPDLFQIRPEYREAVQRESMEKKSMYYELIAYREKGLKRSQFMPATAKPAATGDVTLAPPRVPIQNLRPVETQDAMKGCVVNYEGLPNRGDKKETDEGWQTARQNRRCNTAIGCSVDIQPTVEEESRRKVVASQSSGPVSTRLGTGPGYTSRSSDGKTLRAVVGGVRPERSGQDLAEGSVGDSMIKASPPGRVESADDRGFVATGQTDQGTSVMNLLETGSSCRSQSSPANEGLLKRELPSQPARIKVACPLGSPTPHSSFMKNHAIIIDFNAWHGNTPPDIEYYDHIQTWYSPDPVFVSLMSKPANSQSAWEGRGLSDFRNIMLPGTTELGDFPESIQSRIQTPSMSINWTQLGARVHRGDRTSRDFMDKSGYENPSDYADFVPVSSCNVYYVSIYSRYKTAHMISHPGHTKPQDGNATNHASTMSKPCGGEKPTSRGNSTLNLGPRGAESPESSIMSLCGRRSYDIPWFHQNREMLWVQRKFKFRDGFEKLCSLYSMESTPKTEGLRNTDCPENQAVRISLSTLFSCGKTLYLEVRYACAEPKSSPPPLLPDWALAGLDEIVDVTTTPDERCQHGRSLSGVENWREVPPGHANPVCASSCFVYYASIYSRYKAAAIKLHPGPTKPPDKNFMITKIMREQFGRQESSFRGNYRLKDSPRGAEPSEFPIIMSLCENQSYETPGPAFGSEILWLTRKLESDKGFGFGYNRNFMKTGPKPAEELNLMSPESWGETNPPMTSHLCNNNPCVMSCYVSGSTSPEISMWMGCMRREPRETPCLPTSSDAVRSPGKSKDGVKEERRCGVPAVLIIALYALIYFAYYASTYRRFKTSCPNRNQTEDSLAEFLSLGGEASSSATQPISATPEIAFVFTTNYYEVASGNDGYLQTSPSEIDTETTEWSPSSNRVRRESQQSSNRAQQVVQRLKSEAGLQLVGGISEVIGMTDSSNPTDLKYSMIKTVYIADSMKCGEFYERKQQINRAKLSKIMSLPCPETFRGDTCGATTPKAQNFANYLCEKEKCQMDCSWAKRSKPEETNPNVSLRLIMVRESLNASKPGVCRILTLLLILYAMSLEKGGPKCPISSSPHQNDPFMMSELVESLDLNKLPMSAASDVGMGMRLQELPDDGKPRIIGWTSRSMENAETRYCATKQQPRYCSSRLDDPESAMLGTRIYVVMGKKPPRVRDSKSARANRWEPELLEYQSAAGGDLDFKCKRGRSHHVADALSGNPVLTPEETEEFERRRENGMDPGYRRLDEVCRSETTRLKDIMGCRDSSTSADDDCEQCKFGNPIDISFSLGSSSDWVEFPVLILAAIQTQTGPKYTVVTFTSIKHPLGTEPNDAVLGWGIIKGNQLGDSQTTSLTAGVMCQFTKFCSRNSLATATEAQTMTVVPEQTNYTVGTAVTFTCPTGTKASDTNTAVTCTDVDTWTPTPAICEILECPKTSIAKISDSMVATPDKTSYLYGDEVELSCKTGYVLTDKDKNKIVCSGESAWNAENSECSLSDDYPLSDAEALAARIIVSLGCTSLLVGVGVTMGIYLFLMDFSVERLLHFGQELSLFTGHILVLTMRDRTDSQIGCKLAGVMMQYCFTGVFVFMALEALQTYCVLSNVTPSGAFFGLSRPLMMGLGFAIPILPTTVTAITSHSAYVAKWSCWVNFGDSIVAGTFVPVIAATLTAIVLVEASGMDTAPMIKESNLIQRTSAIANSKGLLFLLPLNIGSWFVGAQAVYAVNLAAYSTVFFFNLFLGIGIFVFHSLGNPKVHMLLAKIFKFKKPAENDVYEPSAPGSNQPDEVDLNTLDQIEPFAMDASIDQLQQFQI